LGACELAPAHAYRETRLYRHSADAGADRERILEADDEPNGDQPRTTLEGGNCDAGLVGTFVAGKPSSERADAHMFNRTEQNP
jgi:hypothetical protein